MSKKPKPQHIPGVEALSELYPANHRGTCDCDWRGPERTGKNQAFADALVHARGLRVSDELTEVRTVLSRAETALERLAYTAHPDHQAFRARHPDFRANQPALDPEHEDIRDDLARAVEILSRWARVK